MLQKTLRKLCHSRITLWCKAKHAAAHGRPASWRHTMYLTAVIPHEHPRVFQLWAPNHSYSSLLCTANSKAPLFLRCQSMLAHVRIWNLVIEKCTLVEARCCKFITICMMKYSVCSCHYCNMYSPTTSAQNSKWTHTETPPPFHVAHSDVSSLSITRDSLIEEIW
jgi:hypothetical protein